MVAIAHKHTEMHKDTVSCSPSAPGDLYFLESKVTFHLSSLLPPHCRHTTRHTRENYNVDHKKKSTVSLCVE